MVELSLLGPVALTVNGHGVAVPPLQRAILACLALNAGEVVSVGRLADAVWGPDPPEDPGRALRYHISRLRNAFEPDRPPRSDGTFIKTRSPGYLLDETQLELDFRRFEDHWMAGRNALDDDPAASASLLADALAIWRGECLADLSDYDFAVDAIRRFDEMRIAAIEDRIAADLALGENTRLIPELEQLIQQHPYREQLRGQLMITLYRSGRQADALAAYRQARDLLGDELGVEPSPELQALEEQVLLHDESLEAPQA